MYEQQSFEPSEGFTLPGTIGFAPNTHAYLLQLRPGEQERQRGNGSRLLQHNSSNNTAFAVP